MSDTDKPDLPMETDAPSPPKAGRGPPPTPGQRYGGGKRRGEADDEIGRELQEAMGGLSAEELSPAPTPRGHKPAAPAEAGPPGRKKGKVHSIRGKDVFVEVPGGRS